MILSDFGLGRFLIVRLFAIVSAFVLLVGSAQTGFTQQNGEGLRIIDAEADSICRDEAVHDCTTRVSKKQAEMMQEMISVLKRTAEIQENIYRTPGPAEKKDIRAELDRLMERTNRLMSELQSLTKEKRKGPKNAGQGPARRSNSCHCYEFLLASLNTSRYFLNSGRFSIPL